MAVKQMPQNKEVEMSVLGVCFLSKTALEKVFEDVNENMFYSDANKKIFKALESLYKNQVPIDATTVKNELENQKNLNAIGGLDYLTEVIDSVTNAANIESYINIIKEKAVRRSLIDASTDIITDTYEEDKDLATTLDKAEQKIALVARARKTSEFITIQDALRKAQEYLETLAKNKSVITGLETGFYDLDKVTSGLHGGELVIIAARPGMGKTAFALNLVTNAAKTTNKAIAIFNLEMTADQLVNRMISAVGSIEGDKLKTGMLNQNDWKKYNEAMSILADTNIYIEDNASISLPEIKAKCRNLSKKEAGLALVVIDYLQLLTMGGRPESRQVEVSDISRGLKTLALELKVPVVALAQLNRGVEQRRESKQPKLSDLRESGSIEQDADLVLFIDRADYNEAKTNEEKTNIVPADLIVAKHRKGSTGLINLLFELNKSCFKNYLKVNNEEIKE